MQYQRRGGCLITTPESSADTDVVLEVENKLVTTIEKYAVAVEVCDRRHTLMRSAEFGVEMMRTKQLFYLALVLPNADVAFNNFCYHITGLVRWVTII